MAIDTGSSVQTLAKDKWTTWGWIKVGAEIRRVHIEPSWVYTVTVLNSRFLQADGTYQSCTKVLCPVTGQELMVDKGSICEAVPAT
jgi:hypothetical protein